MAVDPSSDSARTRDREALEHVLGRPLNQTWPAAALAPGRRVTVVRDPAWDGPWQVEFLGTVDDTGAPESVENPRARAGELSYWVVFDEPQYDSSGGGPYRRAQIWDRYLRPEPLPPAPGAPRSEVS
ncbi:ferrous iron transport protein A [Kitasatospora purpeofusca]|uniref:ferrous iron transport protein A n=1 Tax=Kitasatospora purpeofusca TaxID=67352 RepID=UPI0030F1E83C